MNYQMPTGRDRVAAALLEVANPSPRLDLPQPAGQGMNFPAMPTPQTVASMGAQSPASPSFGGAQAPQQPMMQPMQGMGQPPPPGMQATPGVPPASPGVAQPSPLQPQQGY